MLKKILPILILIFSLFLFFRPVFLKGHLPFPGELLAGGYNPWKTYSYLGYAPGGVPNKAQGIDVLKQLYPWKFFAMESIKKGEWPLWNPYNFSGNPGLANFQTGAFYPLNLVFILPFNLGWTIFIILQPLLAFIFMYFFLRNLKLGQLSSSLGGLCFAFSLYMAVWLEYGNVGHTLLWLPLLLLLVNKLKDKFSLKYLLVFSFVLSFSILAGYIQQVIYGLVVVGAYFVFRHFDSKNIRGFLKKSLYFFSFLGMAILLCSLQLLPTIEIFQQSSRNIYSAETVKNLLLPWFYLVTTVIPDFFGNPANRNYWTPGTYIERVSYIGLVPLVFVIYYLFSSHTHPVIPSPTKSGEGSSDQKKRFTRFLATLGMTAGIGWKNWFFVSMTIVTLLLAIDLPLTQFFYGLGIPILGTTVPTRILAQFGFALAVLAAFGLEEYLQQRQVNLKKFLPVPLVFALVGLGLFIAPKLGFSDVGNLAISKRNFLVSSLLLFIALVAIWGGARVRKWRKIAVWSLLILTVFDLFFFFQRITPFSPKEFVYPRTEIFDFLRDKGGLWRFWGYGSAYIETNLATQEKLFSPEGTDPLFINRYGELISASYTGRIKNPLPRADVLVAPGYGTSDLRDNQYRQRILNLLGVKFILHKNESDKNVDNLTFPSETYALFAQKGDWQVYENKEVVPRIFLTSDYVVVKDKNEIIKNILDKNFPLTTKLILEEQPKEKLGSTGTASARLKLLSYDANKTVIEVSTEEPKLLFLSDNYFPGWQATIDGKPTTIYRADYSFRSIVVPKGQHKIEFLYQPDSFYNGLKISLVTLSSLAAIVFVTLIGKKYDKRLV